MCTYKEFDTFCIAFNVHAEIDKWNKDIKVDE